MMTLRRLQEVVATLNDERESPVANQLVQLWANDGSRPKYIRASANFVFFFKNDKRRKILRFIHESDRNLTAVEAELAAVERLAADGALVARPIRSKNGKLVEVATTDRGVFYVVAFEHIGGEQRDLKHGLSDSGWQKWGRALGSLHDGSFGTAGGNRPSWQDHVLHATAAVRDDPQLLNALAEVTAQLQALPCTTSNFGLIHFDLELDNIVWRCGEPVAIDFDDCARYWFAADVAFALRDLFDDNARNVVLDNPKLRLFVSGYRQIRDLPDDELAHLPLFLRFHHFVSLARIRRSLTPPAADDLDWVPGLRAKLKNTSRRYCEVLL